MSDKLSRIAALALAAALLMLPACKDRNQSDRSPVPFRVNSLACWLEKHEMQ